MSLRVSNGTCGGLGVKIVNSAHLEAGESLHANNWTSGSGPSEAAKEMVERVGKHCSHFVTEEHKLRDKKMKVTSELNSSRNIPRRFVSRASVSWWILYREKRAWNLSLVIPFMLGRGRWKSTVWILYFKFNSRHWDVIGFQWPEHSASMCCVQSWKELVAATQVLPLPLSR